MNLKITFSFATAALFFGAAAAQGPPRGRPFTPPDCTAEVDMDTCILPDGQEGMFLCRAQEQFSSLRPPREPPMEDAAAMEEEEEEEEGLDGGEGIRSGRRPHRGPRGPPLSRSICMPLEPPEDDEEGAAAAPEQQGRGGRGGRGGGRGPPPRLECGCCDGLCPTLLECGCTCDIVSRNGTLIEAGGGVWVGITKNETLTITKCVPPGYADANVACIADCASAIEFSTEEEEEFP